MRLGYQPVDDSVWDQLFTEKLFTRSTGDSLNRREKLNVAEMLSQSEKRSYAEESTSSEAAAAIQKVFRGWTGQSMEASSPDLL